MSKTATMKTTKAAKGSKANYSIHLSTTLVELADQSLTEMPRFSDRSRSYVVNLALEELLRKHLGDKAVDAAVTR